MSEAKSSQGWWALHLRNARGEHLSADERRIYEAELSRQDGAAPALNGDLGALRKMRVELAELANTNTKLRSRFDQLDREIRDIERLLCHETREALGVKE
jgi:hypothetical protein